MNLNFMGQNVAAAKGNVRDQGLRQYMLGVFGYMSLALFITGLVAFFTASNPAIMSLF